MSFPLADRNGFCFLYVCLLAYSGLVLEAKTKPENVGQISTPSGCVRDGYPKNSFQEWLRGLPLKRENKILSYRGGEIKTQFYNTYHVVEKSLLFDQDLEQCADWGMRFWADYHNENQSLKNLYLYTYAGKKRYFAGSGKGYRDFLKTSFDETNSWSVKRGGRVVSENELIPGDMVVQNED